EQRERLKLRVGFLRLKRFRVRAEHIQFGAGALALAIADGGADAAVVLPRATQEEDIAVFANGLPAGAKDLPPVRPAVVVVARPVALPIASWALPIGSRLVATLQGPGAIKQQLDLLLRQDRRLLDGRPRDVSIEPTRGMTRRRTADCQNIAFLRL